MAAAKEEVRIEIFDTHGTPISGPHVCIAGEVAVFHISVKKRTVPGGSLYPHYVSVKLEVGHRFDNQFHPFVGAQIFPLQGAGGEYIASIPLENAGEYTIAFRLKDDPTVISESVKVICKTLYIARVQQGPKEAFGAGVVENNLVVRVFNRAKRAPAEHLQIQGVHSEPAGISMVIHPPPPPTDETGTAAIQLQVDDPPSKPTPYKVWVTGVSLAMDEPWELTVHPAEEIAQLTAKPDEEEWFVKEKTAANPTGAAAFKGKERWGVSVWLALGSVILFAGAILGYNLLMRAGQWSHTSEEEYAQQTARSSVENRLTSFVPDAVTLPNDTIVGSAEPLAEEVASLASGTVEETLVAAQLDVREDEDTVPTATVATSAPTAEAPSAFEERVRNLEGDWHFFMRTWADELRPELAAQRAAWAAKLQELWLLAEELEGERDRLLMLEAWLGERASELDVLCAARFAPSAPAPTPAAPQTPVATVSVRHDPADPFQVIEEEFKALTRAEQREARRIYAEFSR